MCAAFTELLGLTYNTLCLFATYALKCTFYTNSNGCLQYQNALGGLLGLYQSSTKDRCR
jgi:hypothetical protein